MSLPQTLTIGAAVTFLISGLLILSQRWHGRFTHDEAQGIQKFHTRPTPRVGGLALMAGILAVWAWAPAQWQLPMGPVILASLPAFLSGIAEDLAKQIPARVRLLATLASGVLAAALTGVALTRTGLPLLDPALTASWTLALALTAVAVGGMTNAVNIVDGSNGLAAGLAILCLLGLGAIGLRAGDSGLGGTCLALAACIFGFLILNFPFGRIFLGDGGAYLLGFWVAWMAVSLIERNPGVSPAAVLLVCAYPVVEVLFSIIRRTARAMPAMQPDRLHLHSLVQSRISRKRLAGWSPELQNASVAPLVWLIAGFGTLLGVAAWSRPILAWLGLLLFAGIYTAAYRRLALFGWR